MLTGIVSKEISVTISGTATGSTIIAMAQSLRGSSGTIGNFKVRSSTLTAISMLENSKGRKRMGMEFTIMVLHS